MDESRVTRCGDPGAKVVFESIKVGLVELKVSVDKMGALGETGKMSVHNRLAFAAWLTEVNDRAQTGGE